MSDEPTALGDPDIRCALRESLLAKHAKQSDTVLFEELGVCRGRVRLDLAVVNGKFHGYEIKSDRDSLRRLAVQVDFYGKVLDQATLVIGERHLCEGLALLPSWWGVLRIRQTAREPRFETVRRAQKNPQRDPRALVEFLWLEDTLALLEDHGRARGVRGKPRWFLWDRLCEHLSVDEIADAVRAKLKTRAAPRALP